MKIYDISQEVFSCAVYPGDPHPEREIKLKISDGAVCNLSAFSMCAHNGTHVDAPLHFIDGGKSVDRVNLDRFVGYAYVAAHDGLLLAEDAERILKTAAALDPRAAVRILGKGKATMTAEAARVFADKGIKLTWDSAAESALAALSTDGTRGARDLRNTVRREVEDKIAQQIVNSSDSPLKAVNVTAQGEKIKVEFS